MKRCVLLLLLIFAAAGPAQAEDPITAIQKFGLLGTWSQDCTAPITDAMVLLRFTETSSAQPRLILSHPDDIFYESDIRTATIIAPSQIQLGIEGGPASPLQTLIFQLAGDTLTLTSPALRPWPPLHRCISE
jgi:hypothetical protein